MASPELIAEAKRYAKRLQSQVSILQNFKLGHAQEFVARHLYGYKSWNHLCAEGDLHYAIDLKQLYRMAFAFWIEQDEIGPPEYWFEEMEWFGEHVPVLSRGLSFHAPLAWMAYMLLNNEPAQGQSYLDAWCKENHRQSLIPGGDWSSHWFTIWHEEDQSESKSTTGRIIKRTFSVTRDKELVRLIMMAVGAAISHRWNHSACAFIGLFDNGRLLAEHIKSEGDQAAIRALKYMIDNDGEAPVPGHASRKELEPQGKRYQ